MSCTAHELRRALNPFNGGSERRFRHPFNPQFIMTEGVHTLAETAGAFWLMDILATEFAPKYAQAWLAGDASIAVVKLTVSDQVARITLSLADDAPLAVERTVEWTDFPEGEWLFYIGTDESPQGYVSTIMVPGEY